MEFKEEDNNWPEIICIFKDKIKNHYLPASTLIIGKKYKIKNIISVPESEFLYLIEGNNFIGYFSSNNIKKYFITIEEFRNNNINTILNDK
jgi:hypothetical protein